MAFRRRKYAPASLRKWSRGKRPPPKAPDVEHMPQLPIEYGTGRRGRAGIVFTLGSKVKHRPLQVPVLQILSGGQTSQPAAWAGAGIVQPVSIPRLERNRLACAQIVASIAPVTVTDDGFS